MYKYLLSTISLFLFSASLFSISEEFMYQAYPAWLDYQAILEENRESFSRPVAMEGHTFLAEYEVDPKINRVVQVTLQESPKNDASSPSKARIRWKTLKNGTPRLQEMRVEDKEGKMLFCHSLKFFSDGSFSATVEDPFGIRDGYLYDERARLIKHKVRQENGLETCLTREYSGDILLAEEQQWKKGGELLASTRTAHLTDQVTRRTETAYKNEKMCSEHTFEWKVSKEGALVEFSKVGCDERALKTTYAQTSLGQIVKKQKPNGVEVFYEYDEKGRLSHLYSSDKTIDYRLGYDALDHIIEVIDCIAKKNHRRVFSEKGELLLEEINGVKIQFSFGAEGYKKTTLPDGSIIEYTKEEIRRFGKDGTLLYEEPYSKKQVSKEPFTKEDAEFDLLGTLLRRGGEEVLRDAFGNPIFVPAAPFPIAVSYDANSNVASKESYGVKERFHYDALDRLKEVYRGDILIQKFEYDLFNRCISLTSEEGALFYFYDSDEEIGAIDENRTLVQLKLSKPTFSPCLIELGGNSYRVVSDKLGSVVALQDRESGASLERYSYSEKGQEKIYDADEHPLEKSALNNPWRFLGRRTFDESKLVVFSFRMYDPTILRWLTEDPLRFLDGSNASHFTASDPLGLFELPINFASLYENAAIAYQRARQKAIQTITLAQHKLEWFFEAREQFEDVAFKLMSKTFWTLLGYNPDSDIVGITSGKEASDKVRITLINGMLNAHSHVIDQAELVSEMHGNTAVHYLYAASGGFSADVLHGIFAKVGFLTPQARLLVGIWRSLIDEMGGIHSQGIVLHYAHSLGGADTALALQELTPSERKMIRIVTFGSAALIDREAASQVHNYVSHGDLIPLFDPVNYVEGWRGKKPEVVFLPSEITFDHSLSGLTYRKTLEELGMRFQRDYLLGRRGAEKSRPQPSPREIPSNSQFIAKDVPLKNLPQEALAPQKHRTLLALIRQRNYTLLGKYVAKHVPGRVSIEEVREALGKKRAMPLRRALRAHQAITQLGVDLGMTSGELLQLCLYIESRMEEKKSVNKFFIERRRNRIARDIEFDPKSQHTFIHLGAKGIGKVGSGCHKSVTKSIIYHQRTPEIVANCRAPLQDAEEMRIIEALQGARGIVEGRAFITRVDKLAMIMKLYNANTVDFISKNKSQNFTIPEKISIATDLLYGLTAIHEHNFIHRDLHMGNSIIHIEPHRVVRAAIIDFGKAIAKEKCVGIITQGYPPCTSPEAFFPNLLTPEDYQFTDVYALGCTLYTLHHGVRPPWFKQGLFRHLKKGNEKTTRDQARLLRQLKNNIGIRRWELGEKIRTKGSTQEDEFEYILLQMLHEEPRKRGTALELRTMMEGLQAAPRLAIHVEELPKPEFEPEPEILIESVVTEEQGAEKATEKPQEAPAA